MPFVTASRRLVRALVLAGASALLVTGCAANPVGDLVDQGVEDAIEGATGGEVELGGDLPADFPASVPLVDGTVSVAAGSGGGQGWLIVIQTGSADPVADASAELEAVGFTRQADASGAASGAAVYSDGEHVVLLAADGENLSYTVTAAPQ
jgi:hypothetical protein